MRTLFTKHDKNIEDESQTTNSTRTTASTSSTPYMFRSASINTDEVNRLRYSLTHLAASFHPSLHICPYSSLPICVSLSTWQPGQSINGIVVLTNWHPRGLECVRPFVSLCCHECMPSSNLPVASVAWLTARLMVWLTDSLSVRVRGHPYILRMHAGGGGNPNAYACARLRTAGGGSGVW